MAKRLSIRIRRVLKFYPKEIFRFSPNFIRVSIPFKTSIIDKPKDVLTLLKENPYLTRKELALLLTKSESSIYRELSSLVENGLIKRVGSNKNGYWEIL